MAEEEYELERGRTIRKGRETSIVLASLSIIPQLTLSNLEAT
ncbi:MAG: hypothetical protein QXH67_06925 [Candidatus Bathyarchaeia archaeon]